MERLRFWLEHLRRQVLGEGYSMQVSELESIAQDQG